MASVRTNLFASYLGNIWAGLIGVVFIPVYVFYLGTEGYGVIGFYTAIVGMLTVLDMGIGTTAIRYLARLDKCSHYEKRRVVNFIYTYELFFLFACLAIVGLITVSASWVTTVWLIPEKISSSAVTISLKFLAWSVLGQFLITFYHNCLLGLQYHLRLNLFNTLFVTIRWGGGAFLLWSVAPSLVLFTFWQAVVMLLHAVSLRCLLWSKLASVDKPKVDWSHLRHNDAFVYRVWAINTLNMMLTSGDKLFLSYILPLQTFGYYTLAWSLACVVYRIIMPFYNTIYPRFCQLVALRDRDKIIELYSMSCQFFTVALVPFCIVVAFFSYELLFLWTHSQEIAGRVYLVLSILMAAMLFRGFLSLSTAIQLAYGWTKPSLGYYTVIVIGLFPSLYLLNKYWGMVGVASFVLFYEVCYVLIVIPLFFRYHLQEIKWWWAIRIVLQPIIIVFAIALTWKWLIGDNAGRYEMARGLIGAYVGSVTVLTLSFPHIRNYIKEHFFQ